jgi:hypothetical protein
MPRSGSAHDVLMQTLCKFLKQAEHSMGQPFKYGLSPSIHKFDNIFIYSGLSAALGHELGPNGVSDR